MSLRWVLLVFLAIAAFGVQAAGGRQRAKLEQAQNAYAAAIRWGDFEGAWTFVEPAYAAAHPMGEFELRRYEQVQVSGYRDLSSLVEPDEVVVRLIEVRVINRHTQAERTLRYRERWRWDAEGKRWWLVGGLPDFWGGE
ncbi:hypothetical protein [Pseudoxanthomonas sp. PXM04]|uniref:hypothetical protein n=1 Tax=Pseudoxanthomonas sp. PXM04 TaxID=2769297 RepID=UPI00178624F1|nr:hypothetical protein [Pseudoxanthomonas sp. PXM04]MBD9377491.1 hypothetical protein [Pseudoxanthomonas sp. PXM04]